MTKRRKVPPIPPESYWNHPKAVALGNAGYGQLMRLIDHFWKTDCSPLPTVDHQLYVLARGHIATWKANRDEIKAILQDVIPELTREMALHRTRKRILDDLRERGHSARRARKLEKSMSPMPESYASQISERNRASAPIAQVKPAGSGFVEKPR